MQQAEQVFQNPEYKPTFHDPGRCPSGKHDVMYPPLSSMSVVHWARNTLVMAMRKNADYALFVDCDMGLEPDTLDRLLSHGKDIVAALTTRRTDPAIPTIRMWSEAEQNFTELLMWDESKTLIEVDAVGTGVMLISRQVLEEVAEAFNPEQYHKSGNGFWFQNIWYPHLSAEAGEDVSFCHRATRLGYKIYVDTTIQPGHYDYYPYGLKDYLPFRMEKLTEIRDRIEKESESLGLQERPEQLKKLDSIIEKLVSEMDHKVQSGTLVCSPS